MSEPSLFDLLQSVDDSADFEARENAIMKLPFAYPGGKQKSIKHIIPALPVRSSYIEPFGGSAAILLHRKPCKLEVYNDKFGGVVDFYRCLHDKELCERLIARLDLTIHAREEFKWCKKTWYQPADIVERAARWFYVTTYSFGKQGRNFGRAVRPNCTVSGTIQNKLKEFWPIHDRLVNVQIENQSWEAMFKDFDHDDAVFYLDPPYIDSNSNVYKHELTEGQHRNLMDRVHELEGFCAVSGYPNKLYDSYDWDDVIEWKHAESTTAMAFTETNNQVDNVARKRGTVIEALYIKEAR